ncbi:MAG TPA: group I intron-associated PD-(D/E)XK endonuclease [Candidatus Omnitrophota bacterium]|nr:group I intron-associated PD-(D/E)XK endonuclease [Candidatus Omnitrophota bacterium]
MDTKLKSDIAESAVITELLSRGYKVLRPVGDRLPYDIVVNVNGRFIRLQVKTAWYNKLKSMYIVDNRRTRTNRRFMKRSFYTAEDFDLAVLYVHESKSFYIMPVDVFISYGSSVAIVEDEKRQRLPRSAEYRERWDLLRTPVGS